MITRKKKLDFLEKLFSHH